MSTDKLPPAQVKERQKKGPLHCKDTGICQFDICQSSFSLWVHGTASTSARPLCLHWALDTFPELFKFCLWVEISSEQCLSYYLKLSTCPFATSTNRSPPRMYCGTDYVLWNSSVWQSQLMSCLCLCRFSPVSPTSEKHAVGPPWKKEIGNLGGTFLFLRSC